MSQVLMDAVRSAACHRGCKTDGTGRLRPCRQIPAVQGCSHRRDLEKAAEKGNRPDLAKLLEIVQLANADALAGVLTDDLVEFLRKLLYDENLVQEEIPLDPSSVT